MIIKFPFKHKNHFCSSRKCCCAMFDMLVQYGWVKVRVTKLWHEKTLWELLWNQVKMQRENRKWVLDWRGSSNHCTARVLIWKELLQPCIFPHMNAVCTGWLCVLFVLIKSAWALLPVCRLLSPAGWFIFQSCFSVCHIFADCAVQCESGERAKREPVFVCDTDTEVSECVRGETDPTETINTASMWVRLCRIFITSRLPL